MANKKKPLAWILFGLYLLWELVLQPVWNLNVERVAEEGKFDTTLAGFAPVSALRELAAYLPSSFAAGFVFGALIFAYWDTIIERWRKLRGRPVKLDDRAWVGKIWPEFNTETREVELWFSVITVGDLPLRLKRVTGAVALTAGRKVFEFSKPRFTEEPEHFAERGQIQTFAVAFSTSSEFWDVFPDMFIWAPKSSMEFEKLKLVAETPDGYEKELQLWDSMRLTAGEDQIRSVQTFKIFKSPEEREQFQVALGAVVKRFGAKL